MDFGVHLPLIDFGGNQFSLEILSRYTETAATMDFTAVAANDHFVFSLPWLDGPTALAAVLPNAGEMSLATTVSLPVVRGPVALAKTLGALDILSGGRLVVGVGPGSSARDYASVAIPYEERWKRLDESIKALRSLWDPQRPPFEGAYYQTNEIQLEPYPHQAQGPPIWIGSWGSQAGMRRVARLGDGWLASAYNTDPGLFRQGLDHLEDILPAHGKDPAHFPNALATMFTFITKDPVQRRSMLEEVIQPALNRPLEDLEARLLVGSPEHCAEKILAYQRAGLQRMYLWPVAEEVEQLNRFSEWVRPLLQ